MITSTLLTLLLLPLLYEWSETRAEARRQVREPADAAILALQPTEETP